MSTDAAGVTDNVAFHLHDSDGALKDQRGGDAALYAPDAQPPADFHAVLTKVEDGWEWKVTDRWDKVIDQSKTPVHLKSDATSAVKAATKDLDGLVDVQTHTPWREGADHADD